MPTIAQQTLIDRISSALKTDASIDAAWLAGSLGRGAGDAFSDIDVLVLCKDGTASEVSQRYGSDVASIALAVLTNQLFGGRVLNVVTSDWQRFDLTFIEAQQLSTFNANFLKDLFNRGSKSPTGNNPVAHKTDPEKLFKLVSEFLRVLGLMTVVLGREEYALAHSGIEHLRTMTFELMLEENGIGPRERGGALHLNPLLDQGQREQLLALPPLIATRESVIAAHFALAGAFLPRARKLAKTIGLIWPEDLEDATHKHLQRNLGNEAFEFLK